MVLVEQPLLQHTCGLLISVAEFNRGNPSSIPREGRIFISLSTFVKRPMMGERRPSFGIFVVWSASFVSAESLERGGIISSRSFYGQLPDYYSHVFSLIHPVDEFSFKEMRTWGQSKISSCCICVWCKSREIGVCVWGARFPTPMVESFSPDLSSNCKSQSKSQL